MPQFHLLIFNFRSVVILHITFLSITGYFPMIPSVNVRLMVPVCGTCMWLLHVVPVCEAHCLVYFVCGDYPPQDWSDGVNLNPMP